MLIAIAIAEGIQGLGGSDPVDPVKRRGRKKDSLELKAIKAQIKGEVRRFFFICSKFLLLYQDKFQ